MAVVNSAVENMRTEESNRNVKVSLEIESNLATIAPVCHQPTTATGTLVLASPVLNSVHLPLTPICGGRSLLSWVLLPSHILYAKSVTFFVKSFKDTQDISMYEGFFLTNDSDNNKGDYYCSSLQDSVFRSTG